MLRSEPRVVTFEQHNHRDGVAFSMREHSSEPLPFGDHSFGSVPVRLRTMYTTNVEQCKHVMVLIADRDCLFQRTMEIPHGVIVLLGIVISTADVETHDGCGATIADTLVQFQGSATIRNSFELPSLIVVEDTQIAKRSSLIRQSVSTTACLR